MADSAINNVELDMLLETILRIYGYDFRNYAKASLKRRLLGFIEKNKIHSYVQLQEKLSHDKNLFSALLQDLSITVTEMFRDPTFYLEFRNNVIPILKTYPFIKIWHAGCATGEEVYSMAILLYEEGLLSKTKFYATDFNVVALEKAKQGIYKAQYAKQFIQNYNKSGGSSEFSNYHSTHYGAIKIHEFLKKNMTFAYHNLAVDRVFGEMNVILCRNVLIYFDSQLQNRVLTLFNDSLCHRGFLCLGTKESLNFTTVIDNFDKFVKKEKIYRRRT